MNEYEMMTAIRNAIIDAIIDRNINSIAAFELLDIESQIEIAIDDDSIDIDYDEFAINRDRVIAQLRAFIRNAAI